MDKIVNSFRKTVRLLIKGKFHEQEYINKTEALFASFIGTDIVMWLYVLFCYHAFNGWHIVTIGGLIFTILHTFAPLVFYYTQSHIYTSLTISLTGLCFQTLFCLYSGGTFSPSAIWLPLHPVILGFFGSINLIYVSIFINSSIYLVMLYLSRVNLLPLDVLPTTFKNYMIVSSYVGLDILVALFTIAAIRTYIKKNNELQKSKELTENLIRILAHDINNPLTALRYYTNEIYKNPNYKIEPKVAERLNKSSLDIEKITESVSQWISHRDGKMKLFPEHLECSDLMNHLNLTFEDKLKSKNLSIRYLVTDIDAKFIGDKTAIFYQVFNNLISNAIKFSYPNNQIDFSIKTLPTYVEFKIRDYGVGINDELAEKIFSPYYATTKRGTNNEKGTGFGLPIVATIVKNSEGTIKIENASKYNQSETGTVITVQLPIARA